jgi:MoaA/NifB/PqqE/SkfB family radical SAM enzyme
MNNNTVHKAAAYLRTVAATRLRLACSPRMVTYLTTFRCNLRCVMCTIPRIPSGPELRPSEIERVFSEIGLLDAVRISGGEPFLRKDLGDVVRAVFAASAPGMLVISTNGMLGDRIAEFVGETSEYLGGIPYRAPKPPALHLEISIDGVGEAHDAVRGKPGAFDVVMATVEQLAGLRGTPGFRLSVSQTIVDTGGFEQYHRLRRVLDRLGVDVYPVIAYDAETALYSGRVTTTDPARSFTYDESFTAALDRFLTDLMRNLPGENRMVRTSKQYYLNGIRNRLVLGRFRPNPPCTALYGHLRINPDGSVPVCMHNSNPVGNLARSGFEPVWFGNAAAVQRRWVNECPGCWAGCEVLPNAVYSGSILPLFFR